MKKDRGTFVILALILANLGVWAGFTISALCNNPASLWIWARLIADVVAIIALLWLMRTYMKGRKIAKQQERQGEG